MPSIKDQSTVQAIAREYCSNGRVKSEALKTIGYKPSYCNTRGIGVVYSNVRVIEAIKAIDEADAAVLDHTRTIAIKLLTANLSNAQTKADAGDIQAIGAITGIIRELNAISNLHKATIISERTPDQPEGKEAEVLNGLNKQYKLRLAGTDTEDTGAATVAKQA